ncbi:MAG: GspH/FimT family pseudopilin [Mariprofundaceae bacterium]
MRSLRIFLPGRKAEGFTLIEILLVMVIMAVMAAMVAPSFFSAAGPSLQDQARRLAQALRLATDETALTGRPLRWTARPHSYVFESLDGEDVWQPVSESPFAEFVLPQGLAIRAVEPAHAPPQEDAVDSNKEPVLAHVLLPPQGLMETADITLAKDGDAAASVRIHLQPGPGGIRVVREETP